MGIFFSFKERMYYQEQYQVNDMIGNKYRLLLYISVLWIRLLDLMLKKWSWKLNVITYSGYNKNYRLHN